MQDGTPPDKPSPLSAGGLLPRINSPFHAAESTSRPQLNCLKASVALAI